MAIFTKENELMIKQRGTAFICIRMERNTRDSESMINKMARERNNGRTELVTRESTWTGGNKVKACYGLRTDPNTRENFAIMKSKDREFITGRMGRSTKGNGRWIRWTERGSYRGRMDGGTKEGIRRIKKMGLAYLYGRMVGSTTGIGRRGNSTAWALYISVNGERRFGEWADGKRKGWLNEEEFLQRKGNLDFNFEWKCKWEIKYYGLFM